MRIPGIPSLVFLAILLVGLPWAAYGSARRLRAARARSAVAPALSRNAIRTSVMLNQAILFALTWLTARSFGYDLFALPSLGLREVAAALAALAACFVLRSIARALRSAEERRGMMVYFLSPRTGRELALWSVTILAASVTEEAAYRGVGMAILWYALGNPWIAGFLCATAFALAHWVQGWKSAVVIFGSALVMHALVAYTGTLLLAMAAHAVYDFVAGHRISREARRFDQETAAAGAPGMG